MNQDVLVVGAGPAGSVAALVLARAGARVRLIDRATFPRDKLCGDTLDPGSLSILDRLNIGDAVRAAALPITGMTVTGPGAVVSADYPDGIRGMSLTRRCLDQRLLDAASASGVSIDTGVAISEPIVDDDGHVAGVRLASRHDRCAVRARVVIAADGRGSRVASALKLSSYARQPRRWAFGAYLSGVGGMTQRGEMHIRPDGYIGVAPLPGGLTNVSVVRDEGRLPSARADHQTVVRRAIDADPALRDRFAAATQESPVTVMGPLAVNANAAGCPGLLLAGDAAGFVDPMTGDGLRFAMRGGELAAHAALEELESGRPAFERLASWRTREFAGKWRVNRAIRLMVGSSRALDLAAGMSRLWSAPVEYLIQVAGDVHLARQGTSS